MANDVALFEGMTNVPAHLQGGEVSETAKALGGSGGLKRVSIKGSVFRMMVGSEEVATNEDRSMNMVIVRSAPGYARTYYEGAYREGVVDDPKCWSDDGKQPSENCEAPEANACANCPQNAKGSSADGEGRACRYSARIAVVMENDIEGDVFGMSIPATSIFGDVDKASHDSLQSYVKKLVGFGFDVVKVVTEFRFDTSSPVPKLMFRAVRPLEADEWEAVQRVSEHPDAISHTEERSFDYEAESDGEDEAEEEKKPAKKKAAKKKVAKKKAPVERDDDEEEEAPKKVSRKKTEAAEEEDDIDDILDEWADDD